MHRQLHPFFNCYGLSTVKSLGSTTYGENLASNVGTGTFGEQKPPEQILIRWFDREVDYEWPNNSHFTQVLWRATKYVGCDVASKPYKGGMCRTQVCRYARSGQSSVYTNTLTTHALYISNSVTTSTYCFIRQL